MNIALWITNLAEFLSQFVPIPKYVMTPPDYMTEADVDRFARGVNFYFVGHLV